VVSGTHRFDHGLSRLLHPNYIGSINVPERVAFKLGLMVLTVCTTKHSSTSSTSATPTSDEMRIQTLHELGLGYRRIVSDFPDKHFEHLL